MRILPFLLPALLLLLGACGAGGDVNVAPERVTEPAEIPVDTSRIAVPISAPMAELERLLNAEVPRVLVKINEQAQVCIPSARLTICLKHKAPCEGRACRDVPCAIGFQRARITPRIRCNIVGEITRGPIRLTGQGETIRLSMPVSATVSARDIGRVIASETATAAAEVRANVRLSTTDDWQPSAKIDIDYDWTNKPGIDFLGRRITFAGRADPQLAKLIRQMETDLPRHLRTLGFRDRIDQVWATGFTSISLNRQNPAAWLRVSPRRLGFGGYRVVGDQLILTIGLEAGTETFLGDRPPDPPVIPIPPRVSFAETSGVRFQLPVVADYGELEPVLEKELNKLSAQPIQVPLAGKTKISFGRPIIYTTTGGRLAIGLPLKASNRIPLFSTRGKVWFTGVPFNEPNSRKVFVRDLQIAGDAEDLSGNLLLRVAQTPAVLEQLESGLAQDFEGDFQKLLVKIDKALSAKQVGDFELQARVGEVANGVVKPVGQGLYLPVEVSGEAQIRYKPRPSP